jgi:hypothetical protein
MNRIVQWWADHRSLGKIVDGTFVESPQRLERTWAWLMARRKPVTPPRRISVLALYVSVATLWTLALVAPHVLFVITHGAWFVAWLAVCGLWLLFAASLIGLGLSSRRRKAKR